MIVSAIVAVASVLAAAVLLLSSRHSGGGEQTAQRTQHTVLLQVQQPDRTAVSSALLAHDSKTKLGSVVLVPPQVLAQVPGIGSVPFGRALTLGSSSESVRGSRNALSDLLGVTIDGSWVLDVGTFQRLVDQVGGVQVTVDVQLVRGRTVLLNPGPQRLSGAQAETFATYLGKGEQEQTRLARLQQVLDGIVSALPKDPSTLLRSLGPGSRATVPLPVLAAVLGGMRSDDSTDDLQYRSLPVLPVQSSDDQVLFRIDPAAVKSMVGEILSASVPAGVSQGGNRVLVLNGVGTPGLGAKVRDRLLPAGFVFVGSRNAPTLDHEKTVILVGDASTAGAALGARVARALGVPVSAVESSDQMGNVADVIVIVGRDFKAR